MTRKSERELEQAVDGLDGDGGTTREWVERYLDRTVAELGFDLKYDAATGAPPDAGRVPVLESGDGFTFFARQSDVPDWIDLEDLPVDP